MSACSPLAVKRQIAATFPRCASERPWIFGSTGPKSRLLDDSGFGSRPGDPRRFLAWVREYDPDVIWLHNVHGYYIHLGELFAYLRGCGKPIFWTLHDCWSFTGHCAYFDYVGCDRWKTGCHDCPQKRAYPASILLDNSRKNYEKKRALFTGIPNVTLIVPSHWLESRVKESFLKDYPVKVVYNTVNREIFKPTPGNFREKYGLENKIILLALPASGTSARDCGTFWRFTTFWTSDTPSC